MSVNWKTLSQSVLGAAAAVYTPNAGKQGAVHSANAWNPTAAPVVVNVYLVPSGGAAGDTTRVHQVSVPAGKSLPLTDILNLKIVAPTALYADGVGVTLTITGAEADAS
ncbi:MULTISPECIES: hypothetical protein [Burkholderia]|uniref:hypothetical protein n=1 Tax=Burkholderia TaxID=32008 RepID=UPI000B7A465C|nr:MULTISPECIES: hypothetical protein [Burkholderia]MBY4725188.1 hypothetical protein [Burkholderia contaminans]MCI3970798.1 hypothetical protein [Burkholderia sp. HI4860]OXJ04450.1 hypothetical protein CFB48_06780 [Burkholderia sp. AU33647]